MKYQIGDEQIEIDRLVASLFCDEKTGATAICWFVQKGSVIAPVELQQESDPLNYWQRILNPPAGVEIELLVNPVSQGDRRYLEHPVVRAFKNISQNWARSVPQGKVADELHSLAVMLTLSSLGFQKNINWSYFPAETKMLELIKRMKYFRADVGALCQGLVYLNGSDTSVNEYESGNLASVRPRRNRSGAVTVDGRTYRPRR